MLEEDYEIDLMQLWQVIWKRRKFIGIFFVSAVALSVIISFTLTKQYKSTATIIPISSGSGIGSSALGGLVSNFLPTSLGHSNTTDKILAVLHSRTIRIGVIKDLNLVPLFIKEKAEKDKLYKTAAILGNMVTISNSMKTGTITISVLYNDPVIAQKIASAYIKELKIILNKKAFTVQKMNMLFLKKQIKITNKKIYKYTDKISAFQKQHGLIVPPGLSGKKLLSFYTIFQTGGSKFGEMLIKLTNLKAKYESLEKMYQLAMYKALKNNLYVQVIDRPIVPYRPAKPNKKLIVVLSGTSTLFIAVFIVFFMEWINNYKEKNKAEKKSENTSDAGQ